ncbi:DUF5797 family protein [Haladaptatus sp. ZSTT2]|uniref:DUF5797 family protein n=1 Tax=Haladaptatus sp. ZSTT2 TaxID=3120515 RepID=UPI00300E9511
MTLSEEAEERLADIVALQPTKNKDLQKRWGLESGSEVHQYLENELKEYYYRDENSLIRATPEAAELVGVDPGLVDEGDGPRAIRVPLLQKQIVEVAPDHDTESKSVVAILHAIRDAFDVDPDVEDVRSGLRSLEQKGVIEIEYRTVPTFRLAIERDSLTVELLD